MNLYLNFNLNHNLNQNHNHNHYHTNTNWGTGEMQGNKGFEAKTVSGKCSLGVPES